MSKFANKKTIRLDDFTYSISEEFDSLFPTVFNQVIELYDVIIGNMNPYHVVEGIRRTLTNILTDKPYEPMFSHNTVKKFKNKTLVKITRLVFNVLPTLNYDFNTIYKTSDNII